MLNSKDWATIKNYQSHELVRRDYQRKHNREPNAAHTREICSPFIQAEQYFDSASSSDRTVYPLLLYYGVVSLTRGLTLFLSRGLREANLSPSHGLQIHEWREEFAKTPPDIANLKIKTTQSGTLGELLKSTSNRSLLRNNSSGVNVKYDHAHSDVELEIAFGNLLARLPDISEQYNRWREKPGAARFNVNSGQSTGSTVTVRKEEKIDRSAIELIFSDSGMTLKEENNEALIYEGPNNYDALPRVTDKIKGTAFNMGIGDLYLTQRFSKELDLSKIGLVFCISYVMGMLARYYPAQWLSLIHNQTNDGSLPTLLSALDFIESTYPQMALDFLEEK